MGWGYALFPHRVGAGFGVGFRLVGSSGATSPVRPCWGGRHQGWRPPQHGRIPRVGPTSRRAGTLPQNQLPPYGDRAYPIPKPAPPYAGIGAYPLPKTSSTLCGIHLSPDPRNKLPPMREMGMSHSQNQLTYAGMGHVASQNQAHLCNFK